MSALSMEELLEPGEYTAWEDIRINEMRKAAFASEADPLFMQYMRGEATKEEWLAKVEEIRLRYPKRGSDAST